MIATKTTNEATDRLNVLADQLGLGDVAVRNRRIGGELFVVCDYDAVDVVLLGHNEDQAADALRRLADGELPWEHHTGYHHA
jgi:hypothetical protein